MTNGAHRTAAVVDLVDLVQLRDRVVAHGAAYPTSMCEAMIAPASPRSTARVVRSGDERTFTGSPRRSASTAPNRCGESTTASGATASETMRFVVTGLDAPACTCDAWTSSVPASEETTVPETRSDTLVPCFA